MFTMVGNLDSSDGELFDITWDDGALTGDERAIAEMELALPYYQVGIPGYPSWAGDDMLEIDLACYLLAYRLFFNVRVTAGAIVTVVPDVPDGAVA